MKIHVLVLNYNGKDLLEKFLPSIVRAVKRSKYECKAMVVDNLSIDGSVQFLKEKFPEVEVYVTKKNEIVCSFNEVFKYLSSDIIIMLNNDIEVKEDFIDFLIEPFKDPEMFFVAPRLLNFDNTFNGGKSFLKFKFGLLQNAVDYLHSDVAGQTHSIGTGAFRRQIFVSLGGFDKVYLPGVWEEVDLCYRALISGKKGYYEPRSVIWHQESTTFNKVYGAKKKLILAHRNMFVFIWKNISDGGYLLEHFIFLIPRLMFSLLSGKVELAQGFVAAVKKLPQVIKARRENAPYVKARALKDRDIIT